MLSLSHPNVIGQNLLQYRSEISVRIWDNDPQDASRKKTRFYPLFTGPYPPVSKHLAGSRVVTGLWFWYLLLMLTFLSNIMGPHPLINGLLKLLKWYRFMKRHWHELKTGCFTYSVGILGLESRPEVATSETNWNVLPVACSKFSITNHSSINMI